VGAQTRQPRHFALTSFSPQDVSWGRRLERDMSVVWKPLAAVLTASFVVVVVLELMA
jgi:hypothetical protein